MDWINRLKLGRKLLKQLDFLMILVVMLIITFGIMNIYSATHSQFNNYYAKLQILWFIMAVMVCYLILTIDYQTICSYSVIIYWISVLLLIYGDVASKAIKGASSWISLGSRAIEPGEFAKLGLILILAKKSNDIDGDINNPKSFFKLSLYSLIPMILIVIQPNIGMTLICFFITLGIFYIEDLSIKVIVGGFLSLIPTCSIIWFGGILKEYQKYRILSFINPGAYQQDSGFQLMQSLIGIGSGGIYGEGFLQGLRTSGGFIPEIHTDFIFSAVGEEWGTIGALVLLCAYGLLIYRMIKIGKESKDLTGKIICIGTASAFLFSVFQNIGMTIGIMPVAGITLPLMSYGGSSLLANLISIALVLNVGMRSKKINF